MLIGGVNQSQQAGQGIAPQLAEINKNAAEQAEQPNGNSIEDFIEISLESRQKAAETQKNSQTDMEMLLKQLENAKAQGEAMGDMMRERIKCLRIAMSIMAGDKVPAEDIRFLAEKDPELYAKSVMMKRQVEDPKKRERVSEDEEEESGEDGDSGESTGISGGGKSAAPAKAEATQPAAEAAPAEQGGGEAAAE